MTYEFAKDAPARISDREYIKKATADFNNLLLTAADEETKFQKFFERNPGFMPGAYDEFDFLGPSGHGPYLDVLIAQPKISGLINRFPDFMWFASDSVYFTPVIIEIEAPGKNYFNKDGKPSSLFLQARHQLEEWQMILSRPENIIAFYRDFSIPEELRDLSFRPHFVLIYGRREEYKSNKILTQKRAVMANHEHTIMSYDRIKPQAGDDYVCCNVKDGEYNAKYLSPTFSIGPTNSELLKIKNLVNAVDNT
ncbi:MAG: DUF4263 domain-containing protein, partial [Hymenobacter sp.]